MEKTVDLRIAWFMGFGWWSILTLIVCGIGINLLSGPIAWLLYVPFLVVALYMTVRFRLFTAHPWRRMHGRAMMYYSKFAAKEYESAKASGREYDISNPCKELLVTLFGKNDADAAKLLTDEGRKLYYKGLIKEHPETFLKSFKASSPDTVFKKIEKDIDSCELGPDVLIAKSIESRYSRKEAATYLQALMVGTVR